MGSRDLIGQTDRWEQVSFYLLRNPGIGVMLAMARYGGRNYLLGNHLGLTRLPSKVIDMDSILPAQGPV